MGKRGISRETLVAMHETEGIGCITIRECWESGGTRMIREGMKEAELRDLGLNPKQAAALAARLSPERMEASRERRRRAGIGVVTFADAEYPQPLLGTNDPPAVLYYIGRIELLGQPAVGVVGTRMATAYGRHVAEEFSSVFAGKGLTVVSGLARGIDACAHRGALNRSGGTIAVLGLPVDQIYPPENRQLYRDIASKGLLLSEAPPDTPYHRGMFPARNRIIAGLSRALLVVEAPENSGALITAEKAIEASRQVFTVPAPVTSPRSRGALGMLKDGTAKPLIDAEDILTLYEGDLDEEYGRQVPSGHVCALTPVEELIRSILLDGPRTIDELAAESGMTFGLLHAVLLSLQLKRRIRQDPGSVYSVL